MKYHEIALLLADLLLLDEDDMNVLSLAGIIYSLQYRIKTAERRVEELERLAGDYWGEALPRTSDKE